jgi:hypothetical protein
MKSIVIACTLVAAGSAVAKEQPIELTIAAGKVGEICMPLRAGHTLRWAFEASAPADFNLHHHLGKQVLMPVDRKAIAADRAAYRANRSNEWCLMWTAPTAQGITVKGSWRIVPAARK